MKRTALIALLFVSFSLPLLSQQLQLTGIDGKSVTMTATEMKAMPRHAITLKSPRTKTDERYEGVLLADLLKKVDAPFGEKLHGPTLMTYVVAGASDNYKILFAMAEIDPDTHNNEIMVADTLNGSSLDAEQGPLKLLIPGDKRPVRTVRMLTTVSLYQAK